MADHKRVEARNDRTHYGQAQVSSIHNTYPPAGREIRVPCGKHRAISAIPKASTPAHVRENAGGKGWELTEEDLKLIDAVFPPPRKDQPLDML